MNLIMKKLIKFSLVCLIFLILIEKSFSMGPDIFIQSTVNRASTALNGNFTKKEKIKKLKEIAKETVDIKGIGFYTLGKYRKNITDEKIAEYLNIFEKYFLKTFSDRLSEYTNPKVRVDTSKKLNENYTIVSSVFNCNKSKARS